MLLIIGHNSLQIVFNKVTYELIMRENKQVYLCMLHFQRRKTVHEVKLNMQIRCDLYNDILLDLYLHY